MDIQEDLKRYKSVLHKQTTRELVICRAMELIEELLTQKVKNCNLGAVVGRSEQLKCCDECGSVYEVIQVCSNSKCHRSE